MSRSRTMSRRKLAIIFFVRFIFFLIWMAITLILSSQEGGESGIVSRKVADAILQFLGKFGYAPSSFAKFHGNLRNFAHFFLHLTFAFVTYRMFLAMILYFYLENSIRKAVCWTLLMAGIMAMSDEATQAFIKGRVFEFPDIHLNLYGVMTGIVIGILLTKQPKIKKRGNEVCSRL